MPGRKGLLGLGLVIIAAAVPRVAARPYRLELDRIVPWIERHSVLGALGLLRKLGFRTYAWASIIGIVPFAFVWSCAGESWRVGSISRSPLWLLSRSAQAFSRAAFGSSAVHTFSPRPHGP